MAGKAQAVSPSSQLSPSRAGDRWRAYGNMDAGSYNAAQPKSGFAFSPRHRCLRRRHRLMLVSSLADIQHVLGFSNALRQPFVVASVNFRLLSGRAVQTPDGWHGLAPAAAGCRYQARCRAEHRSKSPNRRFGLIALQSTHVQ